MSGEVHGIASLANEVRLRSAALGSSSGALCRSVAALRAKAFLMLRSQKAGNARPEPKSPYAQERTSVPSRSRPEVERPQTASVSRFVSVPHSVPLPRPSTAGPDTRSSPQQHGGPDRRSLKVQLQDLLAKLQVRSMRAPLHLQNDRPSPYCVPFVFSNDRLLPFQKGRPDRVMPEHDWETALTKLHRKIVLDKSAFLLSEQQERHELMSREREARSTSPGPRPKSPPLPPRSPTSRLPPKAHQHQQQQQRQQRRQQQREVDDDDDDISSVDTDELLGVKPGDAYLPKERLKNLHVQQAREKRRLATAEKAAAEAKKLLDRRAGPLAGKIKGASSTSASPLSWAWASVPPAAAPRPPPPSEAAPFTRLSAGSGRLFSASGPPKSPLRPTTAGGYGAARASSKDLLEGLFAHWQATGPPWFYLPPGQARRERNMRFSASSGSKARTSIFSVEGSFSLDAEEMDLITTLPPASRPLSSVATRPVSARGGHPLHTSAKGKRKVASSARQSDI